jgi:hypothetical protein
LANTATRNPLLPSNLYLKFVLLSCNSGIDSAIEAPIFKNR